jgi:hypothetical protein
MAAGRPSNTESKRLANVTNAGINWWSSIPG